MSADERDGTDQPAVSTSGERTVGRERAVREQRRAVRVAGVVLLLVGLANTAFGVLALTTDLVRLLPPDAGMLAALGVATAALGVLVLQGRRWAVTLALVVFGVLFVVQAVRAATAEDAAGSVPAMVTLALVVVPLLVARRRQPVPADD